MAKQENKSFTIVESDIVDVGSLAFAEGIDATQPHCFANVQFFADANGDTPATPGAGSVAIAVETINGEVFEDPPNPNIDATSPTTVHWAANTRRVRATPTGVTVATHYKVVVTANLT